MFTEYRYTDASGAKQTTRNMADVTADPANTYLGSRTVNDAGEVVELSGIGHRESGRRE